MGKHADITRIQALGQAFKNGTHDVNLMITEAEKLYVKAGGVANVTIMKNTARNVLETLKAFGLLEVQHTINVRKAKVKS